MYCISRGREISKKGSSKGGNLTKKDYAKMGNWRERITQRWEFDKKGSRKGGKLARKDHAITIHMKSHLPLVNQISKLYF